MTTQLLTTQVMPYDLMERSFAAVIARLMPMGGAQLFALTAMLRDRTINSFEHGYFTKMMAFPIVKVASGTNAVIAGDNVTFNVSADAGSVFGNTNANNIVKNDLLLDDQTYELFQVVTANITDTGSGTIQLRRAVGKNANFMVDANTGRNVLTNQAYPANSGYTVQSATATGIPAATGNTTRAITLVHAGNAFPEGSVRPAAVSLLAQRVSNYTQIFRNSWQITGTNAVMKHIAGNGPIQENKMDCMAFHSLAIERSLFWGQKSLTQTSDGNLLHTMDGIVNIIQNNASNNITALGNDGGGATNWTSLEAALDKTLQVKASPTEGNIRQVFCGGQAIRGITSIAMQNSLVEIEAEGMGGLTEWGMEVRVIKTARGRFEFIEHPLFNIYGATSPLAQTAIICDLDQLDCLYLRKTREDSYNADGAKVDNGIDAMGGTLLTELTMELRNPAAFGILTGFSSKGAKG